MYDFIVTSFLLYFTMISKIYFDEAYYWCYSNKLELSYCSKPPMIAWVLRLFNYKQLNVLSIRFISLLINFLSYNISTFLFSNNVSNFLFSTIGSYFGRYIYTTDIFVVFFQIINIYFFSKKNFLVLTLTNSLLIYSKQIGLFNLILFFEYSYRYLLFLLLSLVLISPMIIKDYINKRALINHTINSNITNNINFNVTRPFKFIIDQVFFIGPFNFYFLVNNFSKLHYLKYSYFALFLISLFKRINTNWTLLILISMIYQSNLSFKTNYYDFFIIYLAMNLFKIFPFKIKKKIYDYDKLGLHILQELKKQNISNICFISDRKLGSYLWFYTKIKPLKIQLNKNPKDQFDIWIDTINCNKKYILINESRIVKDNRFKILKELKYTYEYSTFYLYTIKFYNNALTK